MKAWRERKSENKDEQEKLYPGYGLGKHKSYATKAHREAILNLGVSPVHRPSFLTKRIGGKKWTQSKSEI